MKLSINTSVEEVKLIGTEKKEIEYRDMSKSIALFVLPGFRRKEENRLIFCSMVLLKYRAVD